MVMPLHTTKAKNAWGRQIAFPSHGYTSEQVGIWSDVRVSRDSEPRVGDRHLLKRGKSDCSGNIIPRKAGPARSWAIAKVKVERFIDAMTPAERSQVTNARKWELVEIMAKQA